MAPKDTRIQIRKLTHVAYSHRNWDNIHDFLLDFGMTVAKRTENKLYMRGYGEDPYVYVAVKAKEEHKFLGGSWLVESMDDLRKAEMLPGASAITELEDAPGGGREVRVPDPDGYVISLLYREENDHSLGFALEFPTPAKLNYEREKNRVGKLQRFNTKIAKVHKCGHYGMIVKNYQDTAYFYLSNFNFAISDQLYDENQNNRKVAAFVRLDRGKEYTDHHSIFFLEKEKTHDHHASFEVVDFDHQLIAHEYLLNKGYKLCWGVGRHMLGSQIFDYWFDPESGFMIEHYADSDLLNCEAEISVRSLREEGFSIWGPEVPDTFMM